MVSFWSPVHAQDAAYVMAVLDGTKRISFPARSSWPLGWGNLPLDSGLVTVLKRAYARQAQERLALGAGYADSGYVAVNDAGEPYTPGALANMWHRLTTSAKVRPIRLHDARHSCGTALHLRGVPLAVIAKWLGHANASITARIYTHSQDDALRAASATLGQVVM